MLRKLLTATALALAISAPAYACSPPVAGDQFRFNDGTVMEIHKNITVCDWEKRKLLMYPVGSKQGRLVWAREFFDGDDGHWIIFNGGRMEQDEQESRAACNDYLNNPPKIPADAKAIMDSLCEKYRD